MLNKIILFLRKNVDKLLHFLCGYFICDILSIWSIDFAILITITLGILKELWDKFIDKRKFDLADLFFTILGVDLVVALYCFI